MNNKFVFYYGLLGAILFTATSVLGGFLIDDYSVVSQYISETFAIDTTYGWELRVFGHIPSGILFSLFGFLAHKHFPTNKLTKLAFCGIGLFYGIGTVLVAVFPCDSGCNPALIDPSISQIIHNLVALLLYIFMPVCIFLIGWTVKGVAAYRSYSTLSICIGVLSMVFVYILMTNTESSYSGLFQRIIESLFVLWVVYTAFKIKDVHK